MNVHEYHDAAWGYWGYEATQMKPDVAQLSDEDLYEATMLDAPRLPAAAYAEVMTEWEKRRLRVKVYRETAPRRKR